MIYSDMTTLSLAVLVCALAADEPAKSWVFFTDKGCPTIEAYEAAIAEVAAGYDVPGFRVKKSDEVQATIEKALNMDGPILVDFVVDQEENVMPMIPPGGGQTDFVGDGDD